MTESELISHWQKGADLFNEKKYWHAHESWEQGWRNLPPSPKLHVQAMIQIAAVFHLLGLGRLRPATSLTCSVIDKMNRLKKQDTISFSEALIRIPQAEPAMHSLLKILEEGGDWRGIAQSLRAEIQFGGDSPTTSC